MSESKMLSLWRKGQRLEFLLSTATDPRMCKHDDSIELQRFSAELPKVQRFQHTEMELSCSQSWRCWIAGHENNQQTKQNQSPWTCTVNQVLPVHYEVSWGECCCLRFFLSLFPLTLIRFERLQLESRYHMPRRKEPKQLTQSSD